MTAFLSTASVIFLYAEIVLQVHVLFLEPNSNLLELLPLVIVKCLLTISLIVTNLVSLLLACNTWERNDSSTKEKTICVALHLLQMGLLWRSYGVLIGCSKKEWSKLTALRLVHASLFSFPYVLLQSQLMLRIHNHQLALFPVLSLAISLVSAAIALGCYSLRHLLHEVMPIQSKHHSRSHCVGITVFIFATCLSLAIRQIAFALMSAQYGLWILLLFCVHFSITVVVRFTCLGSLVFSKDQHTNTSVYILKGLVQSYLNTFELVDGCVQTMRCGHAILYCLILMENLAMTAMWLMTSSLHYTVKLLVAVGMMAAYLLVLGLRMAGYEKLIRCLPDSPASLVPTLSDCETVNPGGVDSGMCFNIDMDMKQFSIVDPKNTLKTNVFLVKRNSQMSDILHHSRKRLKLKDFKPVNSLANPGNSSTISARLSNPATSRAAKKQHDSSARELPEFVMPKSRRQMQEKIAQLTARRDRKQRRRTVTLTHNVLITEENQQHLKKMVDDNSFWPDFVWMTGGSLSHDLQEFCSFDDPLLASSLVIQGPERLQSRTTLEKTRKLRLLRSQRNKVFRTSNEEGSEWDLNCYCTRSPSLPSAPLQRHEEQLSRRRAKARALSNSPQKRTHRCAFERRNNLQKPGQTLIKNPTARIGKENFQHGHSVTSSTSSCSADTNTWSTSRSSSSVSHYETFPDESWEHHHSNSRSRAATWPGRGNRPEDVINSLTSASPTLPEDSIRSEDVVRLWLQGLEQT